VNKESLIAIGREVENAWLVRSRTLVPTDRKAAGKALRAFRKTLDKKEAPAAKIQWVQSPMEGMIKAATQLSLGAASRTSDARLRFKSADSHIDKELPPYVKNAFNSLAKHLDETGPAVSKVVSLDLALRVDALKEHQDLLGRAIRSALDITPGMLAPYDFARRAFQLNTDVDALIDASMVGWVWFFPDVIIVSERPNKLALDGSGRLHCEDGPALSYVDAYSVCAYRNAWVPEDQVLGNKSDWKELEKVTHADVREAVVGSKINNWSKATAKTEQAKTERDEAAEAVMLLGGIGGVRDLVESGE
jgi:hypothetical protein